MREQFSAYQHRVENHLNVFLEQPEIPQGLLSAIRYGVFNGGKRIRPTLTYLVTQALGQPLDKADNIAAAIELIHCYSLVHDDLPAMDNDALRRGKPTTHIQFNEATAILAADAMQSLAFECIAVDTNNDDKIKLKLVSILAKAAGPCGMVAGQMLDIESEARHISGDELKFMHHRKTGDLIYASIMAGASIANADETTTANLRTFAYALGLAFQVKDDILDETGDSSVMGKQSGADRQLEKSTFVSIFGLHEAELFLNKLRQEALDAITPLGPKADSLIAITEFIADRDH